MTYDPKLDYCSFSPDKLFGINFNYACYLHDRQYRNEVKNRKTRKQADQQLRDIIFKKFLDADKKILGFFISNIYYFAVRWYAVFSWKTSPQPIIERTLIPIQLTDMFGTPKLLY